MARLANDGPILDHAVINGLRVANNEQTEIEILDTYEDGSTLYSMTMMLSEVTPDTRVEVNIFVSGVTFDDGTIRKVFNASDFDEYGRIKVNFVKGAGVATSICHRIKVYDGDDYLGQF